MATFTGVGVGPGDPELLTLKAANAIRKASVIAYLCNEKGHSQAKTIARFMLEENQQSVEEIPICMPMNDNRKSAEHVYNHAAESIIKYLSSGSDVIFLCEGDPLFFGSFAYLLERINGQHKCQVIPGITSVNAASAKLNKALTMLQDSMVVLSGYHSESEISDSLEKYDSVVIMKAGRSRQKIIRAIQCSGRIAQASYLEYIGRDNEKIVNDITALDDDPGPYFSLFIITQNRQEYL